MIDFKFEIPTEAIDYTAPDDVVPESKKDQDWFVRNVRYYSTFFNASRNSFTNGSDSGNNSSVKNSPLLRVCDEIRSNFAYYFGRQDNIDFNYLTEDASGNSYQNPWIKGKHAAKLVDFLKGPALQLLSNVEFMARTMDPVSFADKDALFNKIDFKMEFREELELAKILGVEFNPINDQFDFIEQANEWKEEFLSAGEELAIATANEIYERNEAKYLYLTAWLHVLTGGIGSMVNYVRNGRVMKKFMPSYSVIWDNRKDDDLLKHGRFGGYMERLTVGEILSRGMVKDENVIKELQAIARGSGNSEAYTNYYNSNLENFKWYQRIGNDMMVTCVTMFWKGPRDIRYVKSRDRYGNTRVRKLDESNKNENGRYGDWLIDDVHTATLIGNKHLAEDWGYMNNVVRNNGNPELPITFVVPNMTMGEPRATMSMLKSNQDEIDRLAHKIRELTAKDLGKVHIFRGELMGDGVDSVNLFDDLKNIGLKVLPKGADITEFLKQTKIAEMIDMTNNAYVTQYVELKREEERVMEEIVNLSKTAMGQVNSYISRGAQQNSSAYSSMGTAYLFDIFMAFVQKDIRYSANAQKQLYAKGKQEEMIQFNYGSKGLKFMKVTSSMRYEDMNIYIRFMDVVDEKARERIIAYAQAWSQNPEFGVSADDILMLEQERTWTGMIRKLRYSIRLKKQEQKAAQAQQHMIEMAKMEQQSAHAQNLEGMKQAGQDSRSQQQQQADLLMNALNQAGQQSAVA